MYSCSSFTDLRSLASVRISLSTGATISMAAGQKQGDASREEKQLAILADEYHTVDVETM